MIRLTKPEDLDTLMSIYAVARSYMASTGNPNQWPDSYPSKEILLEDINNQNSYLIIEEDQPVGVFTFYAGQDPNYVHIYDGIWLNDEPYGVIHRIASNQKAHGLMPQVLQFCFQYTDNIRIDTHKDNKVMQHLLEKNGFKKCGIIFLQDGQERISYQKVKGMVE